jgi:hypothetical protein
MIRVTRLEDIARELGEKDGRCRFVSVGNSASLDTRIRRLEGWFHRYEVFERLDTERAKQKTEDAEHKRRKTMTTEPASPTTDAEGERDGVADGAAASSRDHVPVAPAAHDDDEAYGTVDCVSAAADVTESFCLMSIREHKGTFDTLPVVPEDSGMFAILDEGCNNSVHGRKWHEAAEKYLAERGLKMKLIATANQICFNGVGGARPSLGCYMIPVAIGNRPDLCGTIMSHMIEADIPLLISRPQQTKLGVCKNMATGELFFGDSAAEAYRTESGLLAVSLGDFDCVSEQQTPWILYSEKWIVPTSITSHPTYPSRASSIGTPRRDPWLRGTRIAITTVGLQCIEDYMNPRDRVFEDYYNRKGRRFNVNYAPDFRAILRATLARFPEIDRSNYTHTSRLIVGDFEIPRVARKFANIRDTIPKYSGRWPHTMKCAAFSTH